MDEENSFFVLCFDVPIEQVNKRLFFPFKERVSPIFRTSGTHARIALTELCLPAKHQAQHANTC